MKKYALLAAASALVVSGCLHGRGVHEVPVTRDYKSLEDVTLDDARAQVKAAHRVGSHHFAPYEATSSKLYLEFAEGARKEGDNRGTRDYSGLAKNFADQAIANGSGVADEGEMAMLCNNEEAQAEWDRLNARYKELDACKAKIVAPHVYAHLEAHLAQAEHELNEHCNTPDAVREMRWIEADINAIWAHDYDGDGITDMHDGEPWKAEDADGFQDEDGIPEPKPYPVLDDVNFDSGSAVLKAEFKGYLKGIADMLNNGYQECTLYLNAHTDSDASDDYNQDLSQRREAAVKGFLIEQGVAGDRVQSGHHGETAPKADNSSSKGKAVNRRCELKLDAPDPVSPFCN